MKILHFGKDGGSESTVWGFWLIEIKSLFSVALLVFEDGSRDAYHSHAFDCISWVLRGELMEEMLMSRARRRYCPSLRPIITRRSTFHKVVSRGRTWVLTFRGPWAPTWFEWIPRRGMVELTHGRQEVAS